QAAALNHRDVWIQKGMYPGISYPAVLGSDGVGQHEGQSYIINPNNNWGGDERVQHKHYHILGLPSQGTFAEAVLVDADRLHPKPPHLSDEEAAALPLAGLTAYRALFSRGQLQAGERVLISGVGGGVALFACQFAIAAGADVWVTSGSEEKITRAVALGAKGGANYKTEDWPAQLKEQARGFDVIIDSAGGAGFGELVKLCRPAGRIAFYGGTRGKFPPLSPQLLFWKQVSILGTTMGSDQDFKQMVDFVTQHKITPVVDSVFELSEGQKAFERMDQGLQFGKIVLKV
ncbi:MAG: zinc-binding dehydrogenase, partial [Bacteroidota bacterium]